MSQILDVVVELALLAATVRSVPNLVYVISTETMSLRPRPPSSTRIEVSMFVPSRAKVTKRIVGDNANAGIDGEAVAGVVVSGVVVLGVVVLGVDVLGVVVTGASALGSASVSPVSIVGSAPVLADSIAGSASGLADAPVEGVAPDDAPGDVAGDSTSALTLETAAGDVTLAADSG